MKFNIKNKWGNLLTMAREIGYIFQGEFSDKKFSFVRPLAGDYPRFHLYVEAGREDLIFNLHLDQKRPVYKSAVDHAGEYDGAVVENEAERIKQKLS